MNEKIPLRRFAECMADGKGNLTAQEAEDFIRLLFGIVSLRLKEGEKSVSIKGVGTFAVDALAPEGLTFTPDEALASQVNAPFAIFTPVEISGEITDELLDETAPTETVPEDTVQKVVAPEAVAPVEPPVAVPEPLPLAEPEPEPEPEPGPGPVTEPVEVSPAIDEKPIPVSEPDPEPEPESEPEPEEEQTEEEQEEEYCQPEETKSKFGAGFVTGLIVGLAIGALALCAYVLFDINAGSAPDSVTEELIETIPQTIP